MNNNIQKDTCGRWHAILTGSGIDSRYLTGKHGPCPICGGNDRWRWDNKDDRGTWFCSHCGAGDGFSLLMKVKGWDFKRCVKEVEPMIGSAKRDIQTRRQRSEASLIRAMRDQWEVAKRINENDPVDLYLKNRGIDLRKMPEDRRLNIRLGECKHKTSGDRYHPTMLCRMHDVEGRAIQIHRTYLDLFGRKADLTPVRMMMPGCIPKGSAIRLGAPRGALGVAEGVETALAANILYRIPVWAVASASMMLQWNPPKGVERVCIYGDNDKNYAGQSAAYALAHRLAMGGGVDVKVNIPENSGCDFADMLPVDR